MPKMRKKLRDYYANYVTRGDIMNETGIDAVEFRRLVGQRHIIGKIRHPRGWHLYERDTIANVNRLLDRRRELRAEVKKEALPTHEYTQDQAAEVTILIRRGLEPHEILHRTKLHPHAIQAILFDYQKLEGAIILSKKTVDAINELPLEGAFPLKNEHAVLLVMQQAAEEKTCPGCRKRPLATSCATCVIEREKAREAREARVG